MLRPTYGVTNCPSLLGARGGAKSFGNFLKNIRSHSANFFHHLRRVPGKMLLQYLVHAARMLQRSILSINIVLEFLTAAILRVTAACAVLCCIFFERSSFVSP